MTVSPFLLVTSAQGCSVSHHLLTAPAWLPLAFLSCFVVSKGIKHGMLLSFFAGSV